MRTYCRICEAACGLVVEHDEHGAPVRLRPDREHPGSRGHVCAKGTRFLEVAHHPERLLHPRVDGRDVGWPAAIAAVAGRLRRVIDAHGPHAVAVYIGNPMAFNGLGLLASLGFAKALGTRNVFYAGSQDCNNKFAGADIVHGSPVVQAFPDLQHTHFALILGSNPYVSQSSFVHMEGGSASTFAGILARGGQVVWVDPRRSESAQRWGEHLPIRPGTDAWLLLGLLKLCADGAPAPARVDGWAELRSAAAAVDLDEVAARTGIARAEIERLAARLRAAPSAALHMSVGVNMGGHGTLAYVLLQALAWATGNYDRRGGLLVGALARPVDWIYRWSGLHNEHTSRIGGFPSLLGTLPGGVLADEILEPGPERIRALLVLAGDPLRSIPGAGRTEAALRSLDLLACVDVFESATGRHAHALLPAATWLERWDVALASVPFLQGSLLPVSGPVMPPRGQARPDVRILGDLAVALGLPGWRWRLARQPLERWLPHPRFGLPVPRVQPGRWLRRNRLRVWDERVAAELRRLRAQPAPSIATAEPEGFVGGPSRGGAEAAPTAFMLVGRRRRLGHNSWLHGGQRSGEPEAVAWLSPADLAGLGARDGQTIEIRSEIGTLRIPARAVEGLAPRTVVVPHGLPELNVNALIPAGPEHIERVSGQLTMTGIPARIVAASP